MTDEESMRIAELEDALKMILLVGDINANRALDQVHEFAKKALRDPNWDWVYE